MGRVSFPLTLDQARFPKSDSPSTDVLFEGTVRRKDPHLLQYTRAADGGHLDIRKSGRLRGAALSNTTRSVVGLGEEA